MDLEVSELLNKDEFERLSHDDADVYVKRLYDSLYVARYIRPFGDALTFFQYYAELASWILSSEAYNELIQVPAWNKVLDDVWGWEDSLSELMDEAEPGDFTESEWSHASRICDELRSVREHRRS
jgi:hypothetical protein